MTFMNTPAIRGLMVCSAAMLLALGGIAGCGDDDDETTNEFELAGTWSSNFGGRLTITSTAWDSAALLELDEANNTVITQNPSDALFFPDLYNRIEYTEPTNDRFFFCTVDFGLASLDAARTSTQTADQTDPSVSGCGVPPPPGFPWTELTRL